MKFRDVTPFSIDSETIELSLLTEKAKQHPFVDGTHVSPFSIGFESPIGDSEVMSIGAEGFTTLKITVQERKVGSAAIATAMKARTKEFEQRTGQQPNKKELLQLKDEVKCKLVGSIPPTESSFFVLVDFKSKLLYLSTRGKTRLDQLLTFLRQAFGMKLSYAYSNHDLTPLLTQIIRDSNPINGKFIIGSRAGLLDPHAQSTVTIKDDDLTSGEILALVAADKDVKYLQLTLPDRGTFVMHSDWSISSLKLLDGVLDNADGDDKSLPAQVQGHVLIYGSLFREIYETFLLKME